VYEMRRRKKPKSSYQKEGAAAFVRDFGLLPLFYGDRDVLVKYWNSSCLGFIASKALQVFM